MCMPRHYPTLVNPKIPTSRLEGIFTTLTWSRTTLFLPHHFKNPRCQNKDDNQEIPKSKQTKLTTVKLISNYLPPPPPFHSSYHTSFIFFFKHSHNTPATQNHVQQTPEAAGRSGNLFSIY